MHLLFLTLSVLIVCTYGCHSKRFHSEQPRQRVEHEWKVMEFGFASEQDKQHAEASGNLKPTNAMLVDVQPYYKDGKLLQTFVTIPRWEDGIPYTLATVTNREGDNGPILHPYPNYKAHDNINGTSCDAIISAYHMAINECDELWVIDDGSNGAQCPPRLLVYNLNTNVLIYDYHFGPSVYIAEASSLFNLVLNVRDPPSQGRCLHTMAYIADPAHNALVVFDYNQKKAWRVQNLYMYPDPNHGSQTLAGESFILMGGIFGIATDKENLYFHPFASVTEYAVPLKVLDNSTLFENNSGNMLQEFKKLGNRRSVCTASAMDSKNNLYCVTINPIELIRWNVNTPYCGRNIKSLPIRPSELEFIGGMKVARNQYGKEELWMVSNTYQKMRADTRNFNETNFRVVVVPLSSRRRYF